jgi:hypothetical protein
MMGAANQLKPVFRQNSVLYAALFHFSGVT